MLGGAVPTAESRTSVGGDVCVILSHTFCQFKLSGKQMVNRGSHLAEIWEKEPKCGMQIKWTKSKGLLVRPGRMLRHQQHWPSEIKYLLHVW